MIPESNNKNYGAQMSETQFPYTHARGRSEEDVDNGV